MGLREQWDWFWHGEQSRSAAVVPLGLRETSRPLTVEDVIASSVAAREGAFSLEDALRLPPVIRGVSLITSLAAQLPVTLYRDNTPADEQPRIVRRPDDRFTRAAFVEQSVFGLVTEGECFWRLGDFDSDGRPQFAGIIPNSEVTVEWDRYRIRPLYRWRELDLVADRDIKHIAIGQRPGELRGHGPLTDALPYLAPIAQAEEFASGWFVTGGIPSVVLRVPWKIETEAESKKYKSEWMTAHATATPVPAVLSGGIEDTYPSVKPADAQLQDARDFGATVVARLLGIPAALMIVSTSGATITYQSSAAALDEFMKATEAPRYLAPIESAWSDLVGSRGVVRFDLGELNRTDIASRFGVYAEAIPLGILDAAEARAIEGWGQAPITGSPALRPAPLPRPMPANVEVPIR